MVPKMTEGTGNGGKGQDDAPEAGHVMGDEADRCPICLNSLAPCDLAVLSGCCHAFCLRCILQWAQMVPSCPVDRRPFSIIYKWDAALGYVTIPVKTKSSQTETQACHFNKGAENGKDRVASKREVKKKSDRTSHARVTEHTEKKCISGNDFKQESSAMKNKKLIAEPCCPWSLDPYPAFPDLDTMKHVTLLPVLAELITEYEQESMVLHKRCHLEVWDSTRQPVAASITAEGFPWRPPSTREMSNAVSPLGFLLPDSFSEPQQVGRWFAFQGKVCVITCAKGEEKATKTTGSKGLKSKTEALPTRTTRNSRTRELSPAQDPCSLQSGNSDSNSSSSFSNQSPKAGSGSRTNRKQTGKRKPKQVAEEKQSLKGNTRPRRKNIQDSQSSPEDVGDEVQPNSEDEDGGEEESDDAELASRISDGEQVLTPDSGGSTQSSDRYDGPDTSYHCSEHEDEVENAENIPREDQSPDAGEMEYQAQDSQGEKDLEHLSDDEARSKPFRKDHVSLLDEGNECLSDQDLANSSPPSSSDQDEVNLESIPADTVSSNADQAGDIEMHIAEDINEDIARAESVETGEESSDVQPDDLSRDQPDEDINKCAVVEKADRNCIDIKVSNDCSSLTHTVEDEEAQNEQSEDNMEMVPMDCDSPSNDHGVLEAELEKRSDSVPIHAGSMASSQASEEDKKPHVQEDSEQNEQPVSRQRKSRFHSPTTTWSPKKESKREPEQSEAKSKDNSSSLRDSKGEQKRSRSRDRDHDWDRNGSWSSRYRSRDCSRERENGRESQKSDDYRRNRNRERTSRRRSRTRSHSRSRSRSRSRNRGYGRGSSSERAEPGGRSPRRRDRWASDDRRNARESYNSRRHDQERPGNSSGIGTELHDNGAPTETSFDQSRGENPEWVKEKMANSSEDSSRSRGMNSSQWEDSCSNGAVDNWSRNTHQGGFDPEWRRGPGWSQRGSLQKGDVAQNRWQPRNSSFSGTSNNSGNDSYSRFNENRLNRRIVEQEHPEPPVDRSGWSSASNWAVCRTLPADVQNYYSRRGRGSGGWSRQDEEKPAQEPTQGDPNTQGGGGSQVPLNVVHHPPMTMPAPPQAAAPLLPFPVGTHPQPLKLPPAPFTVPHQVPMFLHPSVPLLQVPVGVSQGVPPPPPPPPPIQQADSQTVQKAASSGRSGASLPSSTPKAAGGTAQGAPGAALPSSTTQPRAGDRHRAEMHADSSKKEKKLQIQEKAVNEVKMAIKPYYQNKDITKEEYKEIVRKAVEKVCHSKSGEVNSGKVANLVKAYVNKYKHGRKKTDELSKC